MKSTTQSTIRAFVRGAYDLQKLRVETGNRMCANFRTKLGIQPGTKEDDADDDTKDVLASLRAEFRKITDGVKRDLPALKDFKGTEIISDYGELCLIHQYLDLEAREGTHFRRLETLLAGVPIYDEFLAGVTGCGPAMAGVILSELDPRKARTPSSFWKYAGFDVAGDGKGRSRKKEHLVKRAYINKDGEEAERDGITFNPWLKTKLYVLATCFVKSRGAYREVYDGYKHRLESNPSWAEKTKGHRHNAAMRYTIKMFLADLWRKWRELERLEVVPPYATAKLGLDHNREREAA
jgi:hypothetical protein